MNHQLSDRENIEIIPYQMVWNDQFLKAKSDLANALGDLYAQIEHIGSTAVEGLSSKNRIDIQIGVQEINEQTCLDINQRLSCLGLDNAFLSSDHLPPGENNKEEWEKIYLKGYSKEWDFQANIHIRKMGAKNFEYALLFRDFLRVNEEARLLYERFKKTLASYIDNDRDAYCDIKDPVCDLIMMQARVWKSLTQK